MTNQEAIKIIEDECEHIKSHLKCKGKAKDFYKELGDMCIAFYMAIKALEQEPKTGHWIPTYGNVKCSVCGSVKDSREVGKATHYCDFCGAKMIEKKESEVQE